MGDFFLNIKSSSLAAISDIIPCGNVEQGQPECQFCHFYVLLGKIINFLLIDIMTPLVVIVIIYAGFKMITSRGNPGEFGKGKEALTNAVWGMVIAVIAFTIIDSIFKYLVDPSFFAGGFFGIWNGFPQCR